MARNERFPWWEEKRREGLFDRYIIPTRPLLLLALLAGAWFFLAEPVVDNSSGPGALSGFTDGDVATVSSQAGETAALVPTESLLASLFGINAVDPLFRVPDIEPTVPGPVAETLAAPEDEPQRSIWTYLVEASEIGFEANASKLGLALATAERGELAALNTYIAGLEAKLLRYASLIPPEMLVEQHQKSVSLLERYVAHLRSARDKTFGSVEKTWDSPEREAIAQEAGLVNQQIREIVHTYNVVLPSGVLP